MNPSQIYQKRSRPEPGPNQPSLSAPSVSLLRQQRVASQETGRYIKKLYFLNYSVKPYIIVTLTDNMEIESQECVGASPAVHQLS